MTEVYTVEGANHDCGRLPFRVDILDAEVNEQGGSIMPKRLLRAIVPCRAELDR